MAVHRVPCKAWQLWGSLSTHTFGATVAVGVDVTTGAAVDVANVFVSLVVGSVIIGLAVVTDAVTTGALVPPGVGWGVLTTGEVFIAGATVIGIPVVELCTDRACLIQSASSFWQHV